MSAVGQQVAKRGWTVTSEALLPPRTMSPVNEKIPPSPTRRNLFVLAAVMPAQALQISHLTPQSEVAQTRQMVTTVDQAATNFGGSKLEGRK